MRRGLTQFAVGVAVLLLLATPAFYWLTKNFYAEDIADVMEAVGQGRPVPELDLERDIVQGLVLQFALTAAVMGAGVVLTMRLVSGRLWRPFDQTIDAMERFRLEDGVCPPLPESDTTEFVRLNVALRRLMEGSLRSYRLQREFTENASHELLTPLAVMQSKLDLLLQQPELTRSQADIVEDLQTMMGRLVRLNRGLLLLAKMENGQFDREEEVDVVALVGELRPYVDSLCGGLTLSEDTSARSLTVKANRSLAESMVSNLLVNAIRHNKPGGEVRLRVADGSLTVSNTSVDGPLDAGRIFARFYRPSEKTPGNGLGLAIVKAVCDYHGWTIDYAYSGGRHEFKVGFGR